MCKFHKDVAREIATSPLTGDFDAGQYCVALLAMAQFRIEQYMPAMHGCDGFVPADMTTETAVKALEGSGLKRPRAQIEADFTPQIVQMRRAMALTARSCDLSVESLNIPDTLTKDGYKHCAKMAADVTKNGPFMDEAVVQLFEGYDDEDKTWARGPLTLAPQAHKPQFEAIRMAAEHYLAQPGVTQTLQALFEDSLVRVFEDAHHASGPGLKSDGCVMCGHGSRAKKQTPQ